MLLQALVLHQASSTPISSNRPRIALAFSVPDKAGEEEFLASAREQIRLRLDGFQIAVKWSELEPTPGRYDFKKLDDSLGMAKLIGADASLTIQTIDTNNRALPEDLAAQPFASADMTSRWQAFLTNLAPRLGKRVRWISLGNEVDVYLGEHSDEVADYLSFLQSGRSVLKRLAPQAAIGVTSTYDGSVKRADLVEKLEAWTDVVYLTYYPLTDSFGARPVSEVPSDFARMVRLAAGRKLVLQEIGLPASETVGSSEQTQADFIHAVFQQLGEKSANIAFASYFLQYDFSPSILDVLESYYRLKNERFRAFLGTLGLKKSDGTPRKAWFTFGNEASAFLGKS